MGWAIKPHSRFEKQFLEIAESKIFIDSRKFDEDMKADIKRQIARSMLSVARYAEKVGAPIPIERLPTVRVDDYFLGSTNSHYRNGTMYILERYWDNGRMLAHEMFHHIQSLNKNDGYENHVQRSYTEGGADFFSLAYQGRSMGRIFQKGHILDMLKTEINFKQIYGQLGGLSTNERAVMIGSLLGDPNQRYSDSVYRDGSKFASLAFVINGYDVKRTISEFLKYGPHEFVDGLSRDENYEARGIGSYIKTLRMDPSVVYLKHMLRR